MEFAPNCCPLAHAHLCEKLVQPLKLSIPSADYVSQRDYNELQLEAASMKEQLVAALDELAAREREAADLSAANNRCACGGFCMCWGCAQSQERFKND